MQAAAAAMRLDRRLALVGGGGFGLGDVLDAHVYLLYTDDGRCVVVDTGSGRATALLLENIRAAGGEPDRVQAILLTHAHADHAGGAAELAAVTGAPVLGSESELTLLANGDRVALGLDAAIRDGSYPADYAYPTHEYGVVVCDGDELGFSGFTVRALVTPGHTAGSVVWLARWPGYVAAFTGDTVFADGTVSVLNVDSSDPADYRRSLPRLLEYEIDGLFPGHGEVRVHGGATEIAAAVDRLSTSVIPNRLIPGWRLPAI